MVQRPNLPIWSNLQIRSGPGGDVVACCVRARGCGRSAARKSERRRTAPARCRGTYDERADGVHRSFGADEVARLEYAYEVLTRDVLLLMHKERDVRTTARCASGTGDESSSCSMERHADGRSCLSVHRDAPRCWLCSSLRGRARCRSLSYVHEQQPGDEADDEPPGDDSTALRPKTSWARDLLCVDVARLRWVLNWMSQGIGVSLNLGYPEFWGKGTELRWRYVWRCSTIMHM